jgi:nucleoside-diphosphate-sugar epimerase
MTEKNKSVAVLGCGWLGLEVAIELVNNNFEVKGSTTSNEKVKTLIGYSIKPFLLDITDEIRINDWKEFLDVDTLFINLPPSKASTDSQTYAEGFEKLLPLILTTKISHVVFISATSVYADTNGLVDEASEYSESDRAQRLLDAETIFLNASSFSTTIIRFSGLVGKERNPIKYLSGRNEVAGENHPVNLIHLEDCVRISFFAIKYQVNGIFNAAADKHPTKKEYYNKMAKQYNFEAPNFKNQSELEENSYKLICSEKLKKQFDYEFTYTDPLLFK